MSTIGKRESSMHPLSDLYGASLSLLTDLYELTMAYSYWKSGQGNKDATFHLFFRTNPFQGGFGIACGLTHMIDFVERARFNKSDLDYLATLKCDDNSALFESAFLDYLSELRFNVDIDAVAEGTVVFAHEPLVRVQGPIVQAQILETILLNIFNFQTLIATKAARVRLAAGDRPILEFGARRAQGVDGAVSASWAAYIGGCDATSNVLAGKMFGIPTKGTHAHSWVMSFDSELESFQVYAKAMPSNVVLLVDTYDSLQGVKNAIAVGKELKKQGKKLIGIRLDSGDLAYLSNECRKLLDEAGFQDTAIYATNDLDEYIITSLNDQGAVIDVLGVGTRLVTAFDQPALGGVYKLTAVREPGKNWENRLKLSEQSIKISTPGIQQIRRYFNQDDRDKAFIGDMIFDISSPPEATTAIVDPNDFTRRKRIAKGTAYEDLLQPIFRQGKRVYDPPSAKAIKEYSEKNLARFHKGIKRLLHPHQYPVGLEPHLHKQKTDLIFKLREEVN